MALVLTDTSVASEVFRWVDEDGVVNFSQWAPAKSDGVTKLKTVVSNTSDYDPGSDPYSIRNQAERMNQTWSRLAEQKEERRKRREEAAERAARLQPPTYVYQPYPYDYYRYNRPIIRPPIYRPVHPIYPGHRPRYAKKIQSHQLAAMSELNRRPNQRVPYSSVTGVSQRATIQRSAL